MMRNFPKLKKKSNMLSVEVHIFLCMNKIRSRVMRIILHVTIKCTYFVPEHKRNSNFDTHTRIFSNTTINLIAQIPVVSQNLYDSRCLHAHIFVGNLDAQI